MRCIPGILNNSIYTNKNDIEIINGQLQVLVRSERSAQNVCEL